MNGFGVEISQIQLITWLMMVWVKQNNYKFFKMTEVS